MSDWQELETLFHDALAVPPATRDAFIAERTAHDAALATELRSLLDGHVAINRLLDAPRVQALPAGMRLGPYAIDQLLGSGGMSTVYLAHRADGRFDKQVAIKLINQGLGAEITSDRFDLERRILARLEHPHIARLLDAGQNEFGQPFLVMEWVDGVPLDVWVAQSGATLDARLALWLDVAAAVGFAHRHLVIHRDLKPANVLVAADGVPKLLDFGIAKLVDDSSATNARTRTQPYTPRYASPEQRAGRTITAATDIYGLGLLLAELATGAPPPPDHASRPIGRRDLSGAVPDDLAAIISMALRAEPERRYASADQFADDVRRFRRGLPVSALPESWFYQARRFIGRHRTGVALATAAIAALVATTAIAVRQARLADEQRARAEQVTTFITGFLGATPTEPDWTLRNKGVSVRVLELADLMGERLARDRTMQPEAEATLRSVLAMTYYQAGDVAKVQLHVDRALALYDALYGPDDPRRIGAEVVRGALDLALGRFAPAETRLLAVAARWPEAPPTTVSELTSNLGVAQIRLGKLADADRTFRDGLERVETALGKDHPSVGLMLSNWAVGFIDRGEYARAAELLERSASISRAAFKDVSMPLGWALVNLSNIYRFLGRVDESSQVAAESLHHFDGALGPGHFSTAHALASMAYAQAMRGHAEAEATARQAIARQATLPADNFERAVGLAVLGFVQMTRGDLAPAAQALEEAVAIRRKAFRAPNWRIAEVAGWLGEVYVRQGRLAEGRVLLDESAATFRTLFGGGNPRTIDAVARRDRWATAGAEGPR